MFNDVKYSHMYVNDVIFITMLKYCNMMLNIVNDVKYSHMYV